MNFDLHSVKAFLFLEVRRAVVEEENLGLCNSRIGVASCVLSTPPDSGGCLESGLLYTENSYSP